MIQVTVKYLLSVLLISVVALSSFAEKDDTSAVSKIRFVDMSAVPSVKVVHLEWTVAQEEDGAWFIIEKSLDGFNWEEKGRRPSIGNHTVYKTYLQSVTNFAEGPIEYFRLSRLNKFGDTTVLDVSIIEHEILYNMRLIPDREKITQRITLTFEALLSETVDISVVDSEGNVYSQKSQKTSNGYNRRSLFIGNLPEGNYLVIIQDGLGNKLSRSLKVHHQKQKRRKRNKK